MLSEEIKNDYDEIEEVEKEEIKDDKREEVGYNDFIEKGGKCR